MSMLYRGNRLVAPVPLTHLDEVLQLTVPSVVQLLDCNVLDPTPQRLVHLTKSARPYHGKEDAVTSTSVSTAVCTNDRTAGMAFKQSALQH